MPLTVCQNCVYWTPDGRSGVGECRRKAPMPATAMFTNQLATLGQRPPQPTGVWPLTRAAEGCGEGERNEEPGD